jgi:folate-binding protein YgfZ
MIDEPRDSLLLFDHSARTKLELRGRDRAAFLNNFSTNDIARLPAGSGCEAFLTNGQGKILARLLVYALPDALWIDADSGLAGKIIGHLSRYQIGEEVEFLDQSEKMAQWHLLGPAFPDLLGSDLQVTSWHCAATTCQVRRNEALGAEGYDVLCPIAETNSVRDKLIAMGFTPSSTEDYEALRIEAGTPVYGRDIDETNLPQEVNRDSRAISFTKGCYLGQETVARIHALGHVNRLLIGLAIAGPDSIAAGAKLLQGGKEVGQITSAARSRRLGCLVALGYVRREQAQPGTVLAVAAGPRLADARVVRLPMTQTA